MCADDRVRAALEITVVNNDEQPREEQIIDGIRPPSRLAARNADYVPR